MRYILIKNGEVKNIIIWDGVTPYMPDCNELVPAETLPSNIGKGWKRVGDRWQEPERSVDQEQSVEERLKALETALATTKR